eukprot:scaffold23232_cov131-Isochrysis_galbana.AAC.8
MQQQHGTHEEGALQEPCRPARHARSRRCARAPITFNVELTERRVQRGEIAIGCRARVVLQQPTAAASDGRCQQEGCRLHMRVALGQASLILRTEQRRSSSCAVPPAAEAVGRCAIGEAGRGTFASHAFPSHEEDIKTDTWHIGGEEVRIRRLSRACSLRPSPIWTLWEEGIRVAPEGSNPRGLPTQR